MDELKKLSAALKSFIAKYDPDTFISRITSLIKGITLPSQQSGIAGLISPLRQLLYVAYLNLTSAPELVSKDNFSQTEWEDVKRQLYLINEIYDETYGERKAIEDNLSDEQLAMRAISLTTYNAFFHQGPLKFEEQVIEKIQRVFKNVQKEIFAATQLSPDDFVAIYDLLDKLHHKKINRRFNRESDEQQFLDEVRKNITTGKYSFQQGMAYIAAKDQELFEQETNPASGHFFTADEVYALYEKEKLDIFLSIFSISRRENDRFLSFSGKNEILQKSIYQMTDRRFLVIDYKLLLDAIYAHLMDIAIVQPDL